MCLKKLGLFGISLAMVLAGCGVNGSSSGPATLIISSTMPSGTVTIAYSATLTASGGTAPYTWSVSSGALPQGLTLSSAGMLSGTPTAPGSSTVTIQVTDSATPAGKGTLTTAITILDGALSITSASPLTPGKLNVAYTSTLAATGGTPPYTWSLASGSLPAGITLSTAGLISGTPAGYGTSSFSVQATDSSSTPESATAPFTLQVSGGILAVTTTSLPAGTEGVAYSSQLAATGGVPPYSWTMTAAVPIAAGLGFSSTGLLAGTPTGVGDSTPIFTVVDSAGNAAGAEFNVLVQPQLASIPDGAYAFVFAGTSPQGTPTVTNAIAVNGTFTVKSGAVLSGFLDSNTNTLPALVEQPISGGSLTAYANGLGTLVLKSGAGSFTFSLAIPPSSSQGKDTAIRIIEFDDADGFGTRGSGALKPSLPNPSTSGISGDFAFLLSGSDVNQNEQALIGSFATDGGGNITGGLADSNQAGETVAFPRVNGSYSVDANGHGLFQFVLGAGPIEDNTFFHYSFYEVSPGEWLTISLDSATLNSPLVSGSVIQQQAGPFSSGSLAGTSVIQLSGLAPEATGNVPDITVGLGTADGNGNLGFSYDEYNGTLSSGQKQSYTYTVDPVTGRTVTTSASAPGPTLYLIDGTRAFVLASDGSSSSGVLELQSGSAFTNASFSGDYLGGSLPLVDTVVLNEAGIVAADGDGNVLFTTNRSSSQGLVEYQNVAGTYAVDATGRVLVTTPDGLTRIFYIVSPTEAAYLTSDSAGYLGSFAQ
jgi:hypothetical protein